MSGTRNSQLVRRCIGSYTKISCVLSNVRVLSSVRYVALIEIAGRWCIARRPLKIIDSLFVPSIVVERHLRKIKRWTRCVSYANHNNILVSLICTNFMTDINREGCSICKTTMIHECAHIVCISCTDNVHGIAIGCTIFVSFDMDTEHISFVCNNRS